MIRTIIFTLALVFGSAWELGCFEAPAPEQIISYTVKPGDTLNGIAADHYKLNEPGLMSLDDYAMQVRMRNRNLHNLQRKLQIGDTVEVPVWAK